MPLPLISYAPTSQNHRVDGFELGSDEQPRIYSTQDLRSPSELGELIWAAYRQVFHEQQMLKRNRQDALESQLRNGQISVKDFVRGLATSAPFRTYNYDCNSNYRFVELCIQRLLGRVSYGDRETQAWSIVLATQGLNGFIDALLDSEEYNTNFGQDTVPFQRRRILPQRVTGELPDARMPRYTSTHLVQLQELGYDFAAQGGSGGINYLRWEWQRQGVPAAAQAVGKGLTIGGAIFVGGLAIATALAAFGLISL